MCPGCRTLEVQSCGRWRAQSTGAAILRCPFKGTSTDRPPFSVFQVRIRDIRPKVTVLVKPEDRTWVGFPHGDSSHTSRRLTQGPRRNRQRRTELPPTVAVSSYSTKYSQIVHSCARVQVQMFSATAISTKFQDEQLQQLYKIRNSISKTI